MFSDYELIEFSEKMSVIRKNMGFSRQIVSKLTGINSDTLRKIEKGLCVPRFETLELLSHLYKIDLIKMLSNYKSNSTITYFYESIDKYIVNNDIQSLIQLHHEFLEWNIKSNTSSLINRTELLQLELFFDALILKYSNSHSDLDKAIEILIFSLRITIPSFTLSNWDSYTYSVLELRILYCLTSFLMQKGSYSLTNDILTFLFDKLDMVCNTKTELTSMHIKFYTLISYNSHMLDEHDKVISATSKGIELCLKYNNMENLPLLLSRKGIALLNVKSDDYSRYLVQAVNLLEIQNNSELAKIYRDVYKKYGINL